MEKHIEVERSIYKKYRKDIWKKFIAGINEYELIKPGDCIAVCISGGKDSTVVSRIVRDALQNESVIHFFGDTTLEFPSTHVYVDGDFRVETISSIESIVGFSISIAALNCSSSIDSFLRRNSATKWSLSICSVRIDLHLS